MQRRNRGLHGLVPHSLVRDLLRVALIGAVLARFIQTLNSYDGIPVPVMLLLVLLGVFSYVTSQIVFGRRIYSVGSNMEATRLSGINVQAVKLWVYGIICAKRFTNPSAPVDWSVTALIDRPCAFPNSVVMHRAAPIGSPPRPRVCLSPVAERVLRWCPTNT